MSIPRGISCLVILAASAAALAQDKTGTEINGSPSREALLKAAMAGAGGDITALEPSSTTAGAVVIGYSSGNVQLCDPDWNCTDYTGTPGTSVERIAVSRHGTAETIWVSYRHGALYACADNHCKKLP